VTADMLKSIIKALKEGDNDDATSIITFTGSGDYFTTGIDLKNVRSSSSQGEQKESKPKKQGGFEAVIYPFIDCRKPLMALINGPTHGFGVTMLGLFDGVYASDRATFQTRFTEFGLPPEFGSTYTFPKIMGAARANHILMCNNRISAQEAFDCGLVSRIIPHEGFHEQCYKLVKGFAQLPVKSLIYSKDLVRGRDRQLLKEVNAKEQSFFDPVAAQEVKKKFAEKSKLKNMGL